VSVGETRETRVHGVVEGVLASSHRGVGDIIGTESGRTAGRGAPSNSVAMAFPGAEKLLDFAVPFDVPMLDQIIAAFYTPGADPTMVRARSLSPTRARTLPGDHFAGPSSRRPTTELLPRPDPEETRDAFAKPWKPADRASPCATSVTENGKRRF